jgi:hypothetical protein
LSVLAVEVLPGPLHIENTGGNQPAPQVVERIDAPAPASVAPPEDPLGTDLGLRRILRTSPLTAVPAICLAGKL